MTTTALTVLVVSLVFGVGVPALAATAVRVSTPALTTAEGEVPVRDRRLLRGAVGAVALGAVVLAVIFAVWLVATGGTK